MKKIIYFAIVSLVVFMLSGCASSTPQVKRVSLDEIPDYSWRWGENDNRIVSEQITMEMLSSPWLPSFREEEGRKPVLIVGTIRNLSSEHIETQSFVKTIETQITNSGKVKLVASRTERKEIRDERMEQQNYASDETAKALARETGADIMLQGSIKSTRDTKGGKSVITYQVDMELINLETNEKLWMGSVPISKIDSPAKAKW
ncbi:MAG: penicillin-binding protein activator LpoB [Candidatus Cloacimonetes bacterium]|nr:penicillin-binding protein activator LpoB [Candidatus Cloacimonadota bacterium]